MPPAWRQEDFSILHQLDEKISFVATKVVHLGDQLESVNTPRSRDERALRLMQHLNRFIDADAPSDDLFDDDERVSRGGAGGPLNVIR